MIRRQDHDAIAVLSMEHGKANAIDRELLDELAVRLDEVEASGAGAVVLTGAGSIFSAGVDLFRVLEGGGDYLAGFLPALAHSLRRLFLFPRPVVAAINGHAIAGGAILAAACDRRLMAVGRWRIGVPELAVGVPFPPVPLEVLRFATPPELLHEIVYGGRTFEAEEALRRGLVDELVEPAALGERAVEAARRLAAVPAASFRLTKEQLRRPTAERLDRLGPEVDREIERVWCDPAIHAHVRAYLEKTLGRSR
jgi:enoyl-CoA hydratase/carnithine racemase